MKLRLLLLLVLVMLAVTVETAKRRRQKMAPDTGTDKDGNTEKKDDKREDNDRAKPDDEEDKPLDVDAIPVIEAKNQERPVPCCNESRTVVNLREATVEHFIGGVGSLIGDLDHHRTCATRALIKVNFEKQNTDCCQYFPECGRRMLKVDLELFDGARSGWMFNIGDSVSNNGWKGDSADQENDAEIDGKYPGVFLRSSDKCNLDDSLNTLSSYQDALIVNQVNRVTLYISNEHMRITNDNGLDEYLCHECLFALAGQSDSEGEQNEDIYIALNRVVKGDRYGFGVCKASLSWVCKPCWS